MKTLLHVCCAPCSIECIASLKEKGMELTLFWYNPNIHPYTEYVSRRDTLIEYAKSLDLPIIVEDVYGLRDFLKYLKREDESFPYDYPMRCAFCYKMRMEKTASVAKEQGFDSFCSTLFISPYQDHDKLKEQAAAAAQLKTIDFIYRDFRPKYKASRKEARRLGLYMQKYCGCIFSEEERYTGTGERTAVSEQGKEK